MKINRKHFLQALLSVCLIASILCIPIFAQTNTASNQTTNTKKDNGSFTSKDEVVYSTLNANGAVKGIYVVNVLDVTKQGVLTDFGDYSEVKNLTNLENIEIKDSSINLISDVGKFYYQGNLKSAELPWKFSIIYTLDGNVITPTDLVGMSGKLNIEIKTSQNLLIDSSFYENYMLQISVTLNNDKCSNIQAYGATLANSGKSKLINYTVMPNKEGVFNINTDVIDFEMSGINIACIPFNMNIDLPDTTDITSGITTLSDAIYELNDGALKLSEGANSLNYGLNQLNNGSNNYKKGIDTLNGQSKNLIEASTKINDALKAIPTMLNSNKDIEGIKNLSLLPTALTEFSNGIGQISSGLNELKNGFNTAYTTLNATIDTIPSAISQSDINALYTINYGNKAFENLMENYKAAQTIKATYIAVKPAFESVNTTLDTILPSLDKIKTSLDAMSNGDNNTGSILQLTDGLNQISTNYSAFHNGLVSYSEGVKGLALGYDELNSGIANVLNGSKSLSDGTSTLYDGTNKLNSETKDLPNKINTEIDNIIDSFDFTDYTKVSFASPKNDKVSLVQFIITTESIEKEKEPVKEVVKAPESIWDRIINLFK